MNKSVTRTEHSVRNLRFAMIGYALTVIVSFAERRCFVAMLSVDYLGLGNVLMNVVSMLSITELGFGEAIMYSLYSPISNSDTVKIESLLCIYKKVYCLIAAAIMVIGIALIPFLPMILGKTYSQIPNITVIYLLFIANALCSYLGACSRTLFTAYQRQSVVSLNHNASRILMYGVQIVILYFTHNYLLYLCCMVFMALLENLTLRAAAAKQYPVIKALNAAPLKKEERRSLYKNMGAMAAHKIGGTLVTGTDNIIISSFLGTASAGLYANYTMVSASLTAVSALAFQSVIASVGNLGVESRERTEQVFFLVFFASCWLFGWCAVCLLCLYPDFITLWVGSAYLLDPLTTLLIVLSFYCYGLRRAVLMTRDALGLFWYDRYKPLAEAAINLIASIVLVKCMGIGGVVLGTIISTVTTCMWIEPYVLFRFGFQKSCRTYFVKLAGYVLAAAFGGAVTYILCKALPLGCSLLSFAIKICICAVLPNAVFLLLFHKTEAFAALCGLARKRFCHTRMPEAAERGKND